uniref:prolyl aminopeptidase n=1 Tax=Nocardia carnea TaxID=37328 RepID=UPI0024575B06
MRSLYPPIEPYDQGMLAVGDGQAIYWETSGNPAGTPAVFLHGGPGGGTSPLNRRYFDPERYRIVLLDQRGCGNSTPHIADGADLSVNTTAHLISDIEAIRDELGIERWLVFGGSWGSTLSLAYAQQYPHRVTALVLRGIFLLRRQEIDWYYNGSAGYVYPDEWEKFLAQVPVAERGSDLVEVYHRLLHSPDPEVGGGGGARRRARGGGAGGRGGGGGGGGPPTGPPPPGPPGRGGPPPPPPGRG